MFMRQDEFRGGVVLGRVGLDGLEEVLIVSISVNNLMLGDRS